MSTTIQEQREKTQWLYAKGYTISSAARCVNRTPNHIRLVILGERKSPAILAALRQLPKRALVLRERAAR